MLGKRNKGKRISNNSSTPKIYCYKCGDEKHFNAKSTHLKDNKEGKKKEENDYMKNPFYNNNNLFKKDKQAMTFVGK